MLVSRRVDEALEPSKWYLFVVVIRSHASLRNDQSNRFEYTVHTLYPRTLQDAYLWAFRLPIALSFVELLVH